MIELEDKAASVYVDVKGGEVTANITPADNISVTVGQSAQIDVGAAVNYIESGRAELQPLVIAAAQSANNAETSAQNASDSATAALGYAERAETAAETAENMADKDLSNLSATGEAKFDAKQDVISDLSEIRQGATLGATAVQPSDLESYATTQYVDNGLAEKQDTLTAGANIQIVGNTISAIDTTYTAGTGISIVGNVISNTQTSAIWGNITGTLSAQTDLQNALNAKANTADIPTATSDLTNDSGFITLSALTPYATQNWVSQQGYLTEIPAEYVTDSELTAKGYQTAADVETAITAKGYTTMSAVEAKGYITSAALVGYATQTWVGQQGFITGITSSDVTTALGYTPYNSSNPSGFITSAALAPYVLSSSLATVATSGSYTDLSDKPTIPTVNNATITFTQGGTTKGTITLNQANNQTIAFDAGGGSGGSYTAGDGIIIENDEISVDGVQTSELSIDTTPTQNSSNLITSGGVYAVLGDIESAINTIRGV